MCEVAASRDPSWTSSALVRCQPHWTVALVLEANEASGNRCFGAKNADSERPTTAMSWRHRRCIDERSARGAIEGSHTVTVSSDFVLGPLRFKEAAQSFESARRGDVASERFHDHHEAALVADARSIVDLSLPLLWRELTRGLCKVVDGFFTHDRCVLLTSPTESARPIEGRRLRIVEAVLCGVGQKNIAVELQVAPSTVALNARLALESLGLQSRPSRVHPLLMLSAWAACGQAAQHVGALSYLGPEHGSLRVISIRRPDLVLAARLPPAELAVVRTLIEGESYENIAKLRGTSTRTIANQITAVFRRLKVSGRSELLLRLFTERAHLPVPAAERCRAHDPNVRDIIVG